MLHPSLATMLEAARKAGRPGFHEGSPAQARILLAAGCAALGSGPAAIKVEALSIPTRAGAIPARLFRPVSRPRGLIFYVHGGGWVLGSLDDFDALARTLTARTGCLLLLADYRLAPEHPFPAGLEDVEDAILWASENRRERFGGDLPLVAAGDSAGGNLVTVALIALRARIRVALQLLFYPVTDCDTNRPSYREHGEGLFLTATDMAWFYGHYAPEALWDDPRISPLRAPDLSGLPPAWIATAGYDILRDEAEAYADRLAAAGVPVLLRRFERMSHGFARMMNHVDEADAAVDEAAAAIRQAVEGLSP